MAASNDCVQCGRDTSFGSGLFVNRFPADDGYVCVECQCMQCELCGEATADWTSNYDGLTVCDDCMNEGRCKD